MKNVLLLCAAVAVAAFVGIGAQSASPPAPALEPVAKATATPHTQGPAAADETTLTGVVREAIDVAEYTYLRLATREGGELWAAVSKTVAAVGSEVSITNAARMTQFESPTLKRTFDVIYFGNLELAGQAHRPTGSLPPGHPPLDGHGAPGALDSLPHGSMPAVPAALPKVPVQAASGPNAYDIAKLFAQRAKLEGQPARVRGQIVKATPIQGLTYYRIRDGSSEEAAQAELVVSSTASANVGAIVTFNGLVRRDIDVGIGFKYPVMLQGAELVAE